MPMLLCQGGHEVFCVAAVAGLILNALGKLDMIARIRDNFVLVGNEDPKRVVTYIEDAQDAAELAAALW